MNIDSIFNALPRAQQERVARDFVTSVITGKPVANEHPGAADLRSLPTQPDLDAITRALSHGGGRLPEMARDLLSDLVDPALRVISHEYPMPSHRAFTHILRVPNYRMQTFIQGLDGITVGPVPEAGEFSIQGGFEGQTESASLKRFGKIVQLSRQTVTNDATSRYYADVAAALVASAYRAEAESVFALLEANGNMGDGSAWFGASNSASGASQIAAVLAGIETLVGQTLPSGAYAGIEPSILVVPASWNIGLVDLPADAQALRVIRTPMVTAGYLMAAPSAHASVGLMLLSETPVVEADQKPRISLDIGLRLKVSHDFKAMALSRNGIVKLTVTP